MEVIDVPTKDGCERETIAPYDLKSLLIIGGVSADVGRDLDLFLGVYTVLYNGIL